MIRVKKIQKIIHRDGTQTIINITEEQHPKRPGDIAVTKKSKKVRQISNPEKSSSHESQKKFHLNPTSSENVHVTADVLPSFKNFTSTYNPSNSTANNENPKVPQEIGYIHSPHIKVQQANTKLWQKAALRSNQPNIQITEETKKYDKQIYQFSMNFYAMH